MKLTKELLDTYKHLSCKQISDTLHIKLGTIYCFCKRNNIQLPKSLTGGHNVKDLTDQEFGNLKVIRRNGSAGKLALWECQCQCGKTNTFRGSDLRQNKIKTCGCKTGVTNRRNWQGFGDIPKSYWSSLIKNAEQRNIKMNLTIEEADALWKTQNKKCALTGWNISFTDGTASLDRKENNIGYIVSNIQWVHKDINKIKSIFCQDYFINLCQAVATHQKDKSC